MPNSSFSDGQLDPGLIAFPPAWDVKRIDELFEIQQGKAVSQKSRQGLSPKPFLRTLNVLWNRIDVTKLDEMDFSDKEATKFTLEPGDLLVCEGGDIGRAAVWRDTQLRCMYQNHLHRLRRKGRGTDPDFFVFWLQAAITQFGLYKDQGNRTTIPNLSRSRLASFLVPVPTYKEQRVIADNLLTVQSTIEAAEKTLAAARQLKASLMRHLFTYGPVPVEEADRVALQQTEFGPVPSHWQVGRIGDHARVGNGSTPKRTNSDYWDGGTIPWLTSGKVHERIIREANEFVTEVALDECHLPLVRRGSLVIAITGQGKTLGTVALLHLDTCVSQHLAYIQPKDDRVVPEFLLAFLHQRYRHFREVSGGGGSTKGALTCAFLKGYPIPLPPWEEQTSIAEMIEAVERKVAASQARVQALDALFRSLLHHLMTGKLRVGDLTESAGEAPPELLGDER